MHTNPSKRTPDSLKIDLGSPIVLVAVFLPQNLEEHLVERAIRRGSFSKQRRSTIKMPLEELSEVVISITGVVKVSVVEYAKQTRVGVDAYPLRGAAGMSWGLS